MPFMRKLWVATQTSTRDDSGSDDELVAIINKDNEDVIHIDLAFRESETGGGNLYAHDVADAGVVPEDYYMRIGIRGSDAWRPQMICAWCERFTNGEIVLLGYDEELDIVLSTDSSEGRISLPLRLASNGRIRTEINRILLITGTGPGDFATDSPVHVRITRDNNTVVVDHTIPDTSQSDFESFEGNVYFIPVLNPFTRSQLTDTSIELSIEGNDAWRPIVVAMFGLDTASGQPGLIVPLVHVHPYTGPSLSTDTSEGQPSITLPLAPIDP